MRDDAALEERAIARQENPPFTVRRLRQVRIVRIGSIDRIEAEEPQTSSERPQMDVGDKADLVERRRPHASHRRDVDRRESREDRNAIGLPDDMIERGRDTIDDDQVDLGMRNPETLDEIFHRRGPRHRAHARRLSLVNRQKVVQRSVNAYLSRLRSAHRLHFPLRLALGAFALARLSIDYSGDA